ncbi:Hypothetical protein LUCI_0313 [Lucifera butyrica]|uniref:Uncharacterized protein n=1 Tax=Lucifera butyrica TaxID=1351585 RepID=A0A498QY57_9FIRM|nr:hypothetical protein [Lucifera butyrica]VBB05106.1 Hypothetical protein LUCI_0313 [Lucifera butyrica]
MNDIEKGVIVFLKLMGLFLFVVGVSFMGMGFSDTEGLFPLTGIIIFSLAMISERIAWRSKVNYEVIENKIAESEIKCVRNTR